MATIKNSKPTKIFSLLMALLFITITFTGCGKKTEETSTTTKKTTVKDVVPATTTPTKEPVTDVVVPTSINPLTGEANYPEELIGNRSVLVSVENHPQARPQWGISSADIVWEMVAEGGITRMLCMFSDASRLPDKIGPTRSARHYFVEIAEGFDSIFVHFGGSPQGYNALNSYSTAHIDGMSDSGFHRDYSRNVASEHTAYTTKADIVKNINTKGFRTTAESGKDKPFKFNNKAVTLPNGKCTSVTVPFSGEYTYKYSYDKANKVYLSSLNGKAFMDDNGTQQNFTNIIIVYATVTPLNDGKARVTYDLSSGSGIYISNGTYQNITWKKGGYTDIMKFYDNNGKELSLNPGRSYIALVPKTNQGQTTIS